MDCLFCKIINGDIPSYTLYEDEKVKVILDIKPSTNGDCLIIPKEHMVTINDIDDNTWKHMLEIERKIYSLLKEKMFCEGLTIVQNNDYGQEVKHLHIHLTPRYKNDEMNHTYNSNLLESLEIVYNQITDK